MKKKLKEIIPIFVIIYCLVIIPAVLYKYSFYLAKPDAYAWEEVRRYFADSKNYNQEPIVFNPNWLKNYATDYSRLKKFNIAKSYDNFNSYWLISTDKKSIPKNYKIVTSEEIKNLFIFKLKKQPTPSRPK
jgi:hypothetical protein